tara:strand:+ start:201 stop:1124 length:924 start_codon:yes stop_codon:yes gene_type:complete
MPDRHTYASTDDLREYLAGTTYSSGWTSDASSLRRVLESSSRRIDDYCGGGLFGVKTQTRTFDIGTGSLIDSPQYTRAIQDSDEINTVNAVASVIPLDYWLISATTVTSYKQTARTSNEVLTEGYANDYFLMPYNSSPKTTMKLNQDTEKAFHSGQQTLTILGEWGYTNDSEQITTLDGAISSTTATSVPVTAATNLSPAETILVGSEQMYITSISSNTLTVERGVNGTTAATHSDDASVKSYLYPTEVVQACLDLSKIIFRDREMGVTQTLGGSDVGVTRASEEATNVLQTLDSFRTVSLSGSVIF